MSNFTLSLCFILHFCALLFYRFAHFYFTDLRFLLFVYKFKKSFLAIINKKGLNCFYKLHCLNIQNSKILIILLYSLASH